MNHQRTKEKVHGVLTPSEWEVKLQKKRSTTESFIKNLQWLEGKKVSLDQKPNHFHIFQTKMFIPFL